MTNVLKLVNEIVVPQELWACSMLPQGVLEKWIFPEYNPNQFSRLF